MKENIVVAIGIVLALLVGCESRTVTIADTTPDDIESGLNESTRFDYKEKPFADISPETTDSSQPYSSEKHQKAGKTSGVGKPESNERGCFSNVYSGALHSAAITVDGALYIWGDGRSGKLGNVGAAPWSETPSRVVLPDVVKYASLGVTHSMAITVSGDLYAWGTSMLLGLGDDESASLPTVIRGIENAVAIDTMYDSVAVITESGDLYAWGDNTGGRLGYTSSSTYLMTDEYVPYTSTPQKVTAIKDVIAIRLGRYFTAALTACGDLYTWGENYNGQLGHNNNITFDNSGFPYTVTPTKVPNLKNIVVISVWDRSIAAVTIDGDLYTWGKNDYGQLGYVSTDYSDNGIPITRTPTIVPGLSNVVDVKMSESHCAALTANGELFVWGNNSSGQLGQGEVYPRSTPVKVPGMTNIASIELGPWFSAAITADGNLYCWGRNFRGQLGHISTELDFQGFPRTATPTKVSGLEGVVSVAFGKSHSVAITVDGYIYTWGDSSNDQFVSRKDAGDLASQDRASQLRIIIPPDGDKPLN